MKQMIHSKRHLKKCYIEKKSLKTLRGKHLIINTISINVKLKPHLITKTANMKPIYFSWSGLGVQFDSIRRIPKRMYQFHWFLVVRLYSRTNWVYCGFMIIWFMRSLCLQQYCCFVFRVACSFGLRRILYCYVRFFGNWKCIY